MRKVAVVVALLVALTMTSSVAFALPTDTEADAGDGIEISLVGTVSSPPGASSFGVTVGSGPTAMTFIVNVSASTHFKPSGTTLATLVVGDVVAIEGTLTAPLTVSATEVELRDEDDQDDQDDQDQEEIEFNCEDASNHGECVSAAAHLAKKLLPPGQRGKFVSCVARGEDDCDRMLNRNDDEDAANDDQDAVDDDQDAVDDDSSMTTADDDGHGKGNANKSKTSKAKKTKVKTNRGRGADR